MIDSKQTALEQLAKDWRSAGLQDGDLVLIHSSISRTMKKLKARFPDATPADLLESFLIAVGKNDGTLMLPLWNFDFTKGVPFDIRTTPSHMGALTEAARLHPHSVRTGHPLYSFAVIGARAERFRGVKNFSGYGPDSPFAILRGMDGKIAVLDLEDQNSMTFYHHVEEMMNVNYRYHKTFTAPYTDEHGVTRGETFGLFVRDLDRNIQTYVNPTGELLWKMGLYTGCRPFEDHGLRVIRARAMFEVVAQIIQEGRALGMLYNIGE
jgi:aminoglycoside 3-N-acetyltransferase